MFEHFDDPNPFAADDDFRDAVSRRAVGLRRRRPARLGVGAATVCLALVAGVVGVSAWRWHQVDRVDIHPSSDGFAATTVNSLGGHAVPTTPVPVDSDEPLPPMNLLIVGSDARSGAETEIVEGKRADTIAVVQIDPIALDAHVISIPRDLYVPIVGTDRSDRINSAINDPARLTATVESLLGLHVDHYLEIDFEGFRDLVDTVGGVDVFFAAPSRDANTGLLVDQPGCRTLSGDEALSLVRSRHLQVLVDGRWRTDPTSDFGRIERQQQFALAALDTLGDLRSGPTDLDHLTALLADHVTIDDELSFSTLRGIVGFARALQPADITMETVPGTPTTLSSGAAVLLPVEPDTTAPPSTPATGTTDPPTALVTPCP